MRFYASTPCAAPACPNEPAGRYCRKHQRQIRTHGRLTPEREHAMRGETGCSVAGCGREHRAKGFCARHFNAERRKRLAAEGARR